MSDRSPAACYDPREHVRDELTARGWGQMKLPYDAWLWYIGHRSMGSQIAEELSDAFGTSSEFWLNLDAAWQRWKEQRDE